MMGSGIFFPISAIFVSTLILLMFFYRKHINTVETRLYSWLITINFFGLIIEFCCSFAAYIHDKNPILSDAILKLYLVYIITWAVIFAVYIFVISHEKEYVLRIKNKAKIVLSICYWVSIIIIFILPIKLVIENDFAVRYTEGPSVQFTYAISTFIIIIMLYCMVKNFKNLKSKKYLPVFVFLAIGTVSMYFQMLNPGLLLMTSVETYIMLLMYFTIENPDMKIVEEIIKNKNIADNNNEKNIFFIYDIVQGLRNSLTNIRKNIREYHDNRVSIDDCLSEITSETNKTESMINNILDISNIDLKRIPVYTDEYDLKRLIKQLQIKYKSIISNNINFIVNVSNDIPNYMYGDAVRLKQIINSILNNSIKYTKKGFIDLTVYPIVKRDVCRLLITIEDSGMGMSSSKINDIFNSNNYSDEIIDEFDKSDAPLVVVKKLIGNIGGTMLLESEEDVGTKVTIVLDQKIPNNDNNFEYKNIINNRKNIYIADKNWKSIQSSIDRVLYENNIKAEYCRHGVELLQKIRNRDTFDLIVINDNIEGTSCKEIVEKIRVNEKNTDKIIIICPKSKQNIYSKLDIDGFLDSKIKYKELAKDITKSLRKK